MKVAFKTIGCKVNQYETGSLKQDFISNGYQVVDYNEKADIYIINTCAVTREAERKSRQMIRRAARLNPTATIIVTGCSVQSDLESIRQCTKNKYIISNYYKESIFSILHDTLSASRKRFIYFKPACQISSYPDMVNHYTGYRIRGLVKIQEGCNQFCSYCVIPYLRGRARSRSSKKILSEIKALAGHGYQEVVLLGINLGSYGSDLLHEKTGLGTLIREIECVPGIRRIRLSSIELPWIHAALIDTFKLSKKLCHHLHIPLQSGDNRILSLMRRKYSSNQFEKVVKQILEVIPGMAITTDVITGFPGEDDLSFERTCQLVKKIAFSKVHVFPYSDRPFNLASLLPDKLEPDIIKERSQKLISLAKQLREEYFTSNIGQEKSILIEYQAKRNNKNIVCGLTDNYIKVCLENVPAQKGQMIRVRLKRTRDSYMEGERI